MRWALPTRRTVVDHAAITDVGLRRKENEDAVLVIIPESGQHWGFDLVAIVCDGVGGQPRGEAASRLAVSTFRATLSQPDRRSAGERLIVAGSAATAAILDLARREAEGAPLASTVVALVLEGRRASIGHVGDSRAYLFRNGELQLITSDHSFVAEQVRQGLIPAGESRRHPLRSRLTRALGTPQGDRMDVTEIAARPADLFLLCSDGLHAFVEEADLAKAISDDLDRTARRLIDLANAAGGIDNITVALCRVR